MSLDKFNKGKGLRKEEARRCPIAKLAGKMNCWGVSLWLSHCGNSRDRLRLPAPLVLHPYS